MYNNVYDIIGALMGEYAEQFEVEKALAGNDINALQIVISKSEVLCEFAKDLMKRMETIKS